MVTAELDWVLGITRSHFAPQKLIPSRNGPAAMSHQLLGIHLRFWNTSESQRLTKSKLSPFRIQIEGADGRQNVLHLAHSRYSAVSSTRRKGTSTGAEGKNIVSGCAWHLSDIHGAPENMAR